MRVNTLRSAERCTCQVCSLLAEAARPAATVCTHCVADPERARQLLQARTEGAAQRSVAAWLHLNRAVDALGPYAPRWARLRQALEEVHVLVADAATQQRVRLALEAAESGDTRALPSPLAAVLLASEAHYWAQDAAKRARTQSEVAALALEDCLDQSAAA